MPKKRRREDRTPPLQPSEVEKFDPEDFSFALSVASASYALKMPMESPSKHSIILVDEESGNESKITFTDIPDNRMGFALADHFDRDARRLGSFMYRFWALQKLRDDRRMTPYVKSFGDQVGIHMAVLETAAQLPLGDGFEFETDVFFKHAAKLLATREYESDEEE